jgi:hypothetical protein
VNLLFGPKDDFTYSCTTGEPPYTQRAGTHREEDAITISSGAGALLVIWGVSPRYQAEKEQK